MPIYEYACSHCSKKFDVFFMTASTAAPHLESYVCECGKEAERFLSKPPKVFFRDNEKPYYSSPANPDKM